MGIWKSSRFIYFVTIFLLALTNFIAGWLGLLLAVPPGYSTAVFPPSGIALGAVLIFGYRVWPGVFVGAFMLAAFGRANSLESCFLAASIAFGVTLQAVVGALLIRRVVGFPTPLDDGRLIGNFFILGGPVSCLISATWAIGSLSLAGVMTGGYAFNWFTWWIGDTIGVLIFTPSMLVVFGKPRRLWRARRLSVGVPLVIAFLGTVLLFFFAKNLEQASIEREFERRADSHVMALEQAIASHVESLWPLRVHLSGSTEVTQAAFRSHAEQTLSENPGVLAITWNPLVLDTEREAFEAQAKEQVRPDFEIRERNSHGQWQRSPPRDEYIVALYVEPFEDNQEVLGMNVAATTGCRDALAEARNTGKPVASCRLDWMSEQDNQAGVPIFMPVYRSNATLQNDEQRRTALLGYSAHILGIDDIVANVLTELAKDGLQLRIIDETDSAGDARSQLLYGADAVADMLRFDVDRDVAGRSWHFEFFATDGFQVGYTWQAWFVLAGGLLFTSLLVFVLLSTTGRSSRVEKLVEQRTQELLHEQQLLRELIKLQDRERQMVAHDLHDGFVQEVVGAHMLVQSANHDMSETIDAQMDKASYFLKKAIDEARRLIGDLRPMVIEEHGVVEAIKHLIAEQEQQYGMTVVFVHEVDFDRLDPTLEGVIFRIVQESLRNVVHHAETEHAVVRLTQHDDNLTIEIRDGGKGFEPDTVPPSRFGLRGIVDRARIFGGKASIESAPGEGTIVHVELPILAQEANNGE